MKTLIFDLDGTLVHLKPTLVCLADVDNLTLLRKQYNFALVSGGTRDEVLWAMTETGLRPLFDDDCIVAFEDTNGEKTSGKPFQEIRKRLRGDMVMIGDSVSDETGAKIAGLSFVRVQSRTNVDEQRGELAAAIGKAVAVIKTPAYR